MEAFFFPHKSHGYPPTFSLPSTLSIPYLIPSRRPGSTHPLDLFVTCFAEGRLGCIYNSQLQLAGFFLLSSTPLIQFAHSLLLTSKQYLTMSGQTFNREAFSDLDCTNIEVDSGMVCFVLTRLISCETIRHPVDEKH